MGGLSRPAADAQSAIVRDAQQVLAHHGKSFAWAARWLGEGEAARTALLYAFCRRLDDLVDEKPPEEAREALACVRRDLARGASGDPVVASFLQLRREIGLPRAVVDAFVDGLASDLGPVRVAHPSALVRYAYGAAGSVGVMLCAAFGVRDARALPFAVDLGVAMQLTNIARDVLEDARRDRVYLPESLLSPRVTPRALVLGDPEARIEAYVAVRRLLDLADRFYRSADLGMRFLPWRARLAVLTASRVYEAIGGAIGREPHLYWKRRAVVGRAGKLWHTLRAVASLVARPRYWNVRRAPVHDAQLHVPLRGLPGADPAS